ncbi:MAG: DNA translocase SpoIIIE [Candidatus Marinimicrobia bacterium]|nr:DNA translocase SpoIIIE [Candidatus Neomarinimicrobiota bacterium]
MDEEVIEDIVDFDSSKEKAKRREYKLPSSDLLEAPDEVEEGATREELVENARQLERSLREFGVEAKVVHISPGPIITRYELEPAKGVRINKFTSLADDLARVMRAQRVRVLAPIPGKAAVGIEIPNKHGATVYLKHIINSDAFVSAEHTLTFAMGKTTSGEAYVSNLAKMPHVLIAGATGSGKSVCINTMIMSLLYRAKPTELKLIMVDPKKLELSVYQQLEGYHLITSEDLDEYVITKPSNAVTALRSAEIEMERRYELLADAAVRDIDEYNRSVDSGEHEGEHLPYIVVVIDELADLMITASKEVEEPISRIAQMARAVGIHLIIATQRPSVDVLTGVIKANFPARIAFQVASKTDSRTILDANGAEKLLGKGDMLFLPPAQPEPIRLHNSFVTLEEIEAVLDHINKQPRAEAMELPSLNEASETNTFSVGNERDELFHDALKLVVTHDQGSISLLQRRLRIGYSRAARIIDQLEEAGIVGGHEGSKARDVLVDESIIEEIENGEIDI